MPVIKDLVPDLNSILRTIPLYQTLDADRVSATARQRTFTV